MPTLNVCVQIYMNKKNTQNLLKVQIFLFFLEALSMYQYDKETNFVCFFYSCIYIYIYMYIYIQLYIIYTFYIHNFVYSYFKLSIELLNCSESSLFLLVLS